MLCVVSFKMPKEKKEFVSVTLKKWIQNENNKLFWPPKSLFYKTQPIDRQMTPEDNWTQLEYKMLKDNIGKYHNLYYKHFNNKIVLI